MLLPQFKSNPLSDWQLRIPKIGKVQINLHRPIPEGFVIKQVRVVKKAMGLVCGDSYSIGYRAT